MRRNWKEKRHPSEERVAEIPVSGANRGKGGGSLQRQANLCELDRTWCGDRHVVKDDHFMCDGGGRHAGECAKYDTHGYHGKRRCSECGDSGFGAGED